MNDEKSEMKRQMLAESKASEKAFESKLDKQQVNMS